MLFWHSNDVKLYHSFINFIGIDRSACMWGKSLRFAVCWWRRSASYSDEKCRASDYMTIEKLPPECAFFVVQGRVRVMNKWQHPCDVLCPVTIPAYAMTERTASSFIHGQVWREQELVDCTQPLLPDTSSHSIFLLCGTQMCILLLSPSTWKGRAVHVHPPMFINELNKHWLVVLHGLNPPGHHLVCDLKSIQPINT